jgi:hypothetical protein
LERLISNFKGQIKQCPTGASTNRTSKEQKRQAKPKAALAAAEATMQTQAAPVGEAKNAMKESEAGAPAGLGGETRYREADYDLAEGPRDHAHRDFQMPKDKRSRGFIEMYMSGDADVVDLTGSHFMKKEVRKVRLAVRSGKQCAVCGKPPGDVVWLGGFIVDGASKNDFGTPDEEKVAAPICVDCRGHVRGRIVLSGPCVGCGRMVHLTPGALMSWLERDKRIACCTDCANAPPPLPSKNCEACGKPFAAKRTDARYCDPACRKSASREKFIAIKTNR